MFGPECGVASVLGVEGQYLGEEDPVFLWPAALLKEMEGVSKAVTMVAVLAELKRTGCPC